MTDVRMPSLGMAMTEGVLVRWLKRDGDVVAEGEAIAEVETDKTTVEIESPAAGRLSGLTHQEGDTVPTGSVIARIVSVEAAVPVAEAAGSAPVAPSAASRSRAAAAPESPREAQEAPESPREAQAAPPELAGMAGWPRPGVRRLLEESAPGPIDLRQAPGQDLIEWLEAMELIRELERVADRLSLDGRIPGGIHSSAGQEAVAVGSIRALGRDDVIAGSHRSHHHALAKGLSPREVMAELYGKATGCVGGRGGHMHLADLERGLYGSNGIVGGGLGIALGVALSFQVQRRPAVALGYFGDGGANTGRVWEFVNLAALWRLPLLIVCENNQYAVETHVSRAMAGESIAARAAGFGLPAVMIDGQDVGQVYRVTYEARQRALAGEGPTFIEALTYRYQGHHTGDKGAYRTADEIERWRRERDPIDRLRDALLAHGVVTQEEVTAIQERVKDAVADAVDFAEASPWPEPDRALAGVDGVAHGAGRGR
jgi:TPP-dependent pyruvate/acetoin dehydrogenase alpha subunit